MASLFKLKDHYKEHQLFLNRAVAASGMMLAMFLILLVRQFFLQVYQHENYEMQALNNQVRVLSVPPTRGLIYDRNGVVIADNVPSYSLEVIPSKVKHINHLIKQLKKIIDISENDITNFKKQIRYKGRFESIPIKNKLTEEEVAVFSANKFLFKEVEVKAYLARNYPFGESFSHVLGYTGPISEHDLKHIEISKYRGIHSIGKSGIEKFYEGSLLGSSGFEKVETDARGRIVQILEETLPKPGRDIYLNIDSKLQNLAYKKLGRHQGAVVAIDVNTGGLLALVSKPGFDPNHFVRGIDNKTYAKLQNEPTQPLFHRAIRGQYPPGSIVKPIVALKALENNIIKPNERIFDPGYYKIHEEGRLFRDWKPEGHGFINIENAIAQSCTTFFYFLSDKLGIDKINEVYKDFGLGQYTYVDITGESKGIAPSPEWKKYTKGQNWFHGETLITGIGQGYTLVTPIQMAKMAATIANRGHKVQPKLVMAFTDENKNLIQNESSTSGKIEFKKSDWDLVIRGMKRSVRSMNGTARSIWNNTDNYQIAGKTGTAQVFGIKQDEKYERDKIKANLRDHAWFIAFAPIKKPQIAIAVILEHGRGSPIIAKSIADAYFEDSNGKG